MDRVIRFKIHTSRSLLPAAKGQLLDIAVLVRTSARGQVTGLIEYPASPNEYVPGTKYQLIADAGYVLTMPGVVAAERLMVGESFHMPSTDMSHMPVIACDRSSRKDADKK
jgi:hypothetical protein